MSDSIVQERHFFSCCKNLTVGPLDKCSSRASEQRPDSSILVSKPTESGQDQTCIYLKNRAWAIEPTMAVRDPHGHIRELELETLSHMTKNVSKE